MRKILVADDSSTIRRIVEHALTASSTRVLQAAEGLAAIELAIAERPDLVLCDVSMPGLSGYDVAERLKREPQTASIPVVFLAGAFERYDEHRAQQSGAIARLDKPFEIGALVDTVTRALARDRGGAATEARVSGSSAPAFSGIPRVDAFPPQPPTSFRRVADHDLPEPIPVEHVVASEGVQEEDAVLIEESLPDDAFERPAIPRVALPGDEGFELTPRIPRAHSAAVLTQTDVPFEGSTLDDAIEAAVRRRVDLIAADIVREVAWEIAPDLLERLLRESIAKRTRSGDGGDNRR